MKSILSVLSLVAGLTAVSGCLYRAPVVPPPGLLYSDVKASVSTEASGMVGPKQGMAMMTNYFGLYAKGDASISKAARNGNIEDIDLVEYQHTNFLGIQSYTTIVHGR